MSPLLARQAPPYKETLGWIQLDLTGDHTGAYVDPASMDLFFHLFGGGAALCAGSPVPSGPITQGLRPWVYI